MSPKAQDYTEPLASSARKKAGGTEIAELRPTGSAYQINPKYKMQGVVATPVGYETKLKQLIRKTKHKLAAVNYTKYIMRTYYIPGGRTYRQEYRGS